MHTNWLKRLFIGLCCALVLGLVTAVTLQARTPQQEAQAEDCASCHEPIYTEWESSGHSDVTGIPGVPAWSETAMGQVDAPNAACLVCHPTDPAEHPQRIMYTDSSSQQCGNCHENTFMEWEDSAHGEVEMDCSGCHNPHSRELRTGGVANTCAACHKEETHFYTFTEHAAEGLDCTDCHMKMVEDSNSNETMRRMHTMIAGMESCNECHDQEMHYPETDQAAPPSANPMIVQAGFQPPLGDVDEDQLESEPAPNSSLNFILLAAFIGMLFGVAGSSWLEKKFRSSE